MDPRFEFGEFSPEHVAEWVERLEKIYDPTTQSLTRPLSHEEEAFIRHEINRSKADFRYWAVRYARIKDKQMNLVPLIPTVVQELFLKKAADMELDAISGKTGDGILLIVLKARQLGVCLHPDTKVLTSDLRYVRIDDLQIGQEVVATDEMPCNKRKGRRMRTAVVQAKHDVIEPAFRLTMSDGRQLIATGQHRFLGKIRGSTSTTWRSVQDTKVGDEIRYVTSSWGPSTHEDYWFGGILDGEGSLRVKAGVEITASQRENVVLDRMRAFANTYSVREEVDDRVAGEGSKLGDEPIYKLVFSRMDEAFEILGRTRPTRFLNIRWWEGRELPGKKSGIGWSKVISIEPLEVQRMIDIQTSTKTFIAEGFVSHNSTISDMILAHRTFFYGNTTALIAADSDDRTPNLYEMVIRCYDNLPWWMQPRSADPKRDYRVKNKQIYFADQDSVVRFGSSGNMQGGDSGQEKGSLGTGMTLPLVHLSELALWQNPYQIMDALMPSIPMSPRSFAVLESTAKGRGNWWHEKWEAAKRGLGRFRPVFIPWYTDPGTYKKPAPADYVPSDRALQHAERVKNTSERWVGKVVHLTRDQLFWWETTRAEYVDGKILPKFLAEFTSDDLESFQNTTIGVFPADMLDDMRHNTTRMPILVEIKPKTTLRGFSA